MTERDNAEDEASVELIRKTVAALGRAIERGDWSTAREMWSWFRPLHAELIALDPNFAHVEKKLQQNETFAGPSVGGVH